MNETAPAPAPGAVPPRRYGVTQGGMLPADTGTALALEEIARLGFTVLDRVLAPPLVARMGAALMRILAAQTARFGVARTRAIGDANTARALLDEDDCFLELLCLPPLEAIVSALLGPAALVTQQNGIVMPGDGAAHNQQAWHRDLPYQSWVASRPLALGALLALDPFTEQSGATLFLPGSHRHETFPSDAFAARWQCPVLATAGSVIVFDAMVFHRGGVNRGTGPRRAVNTVFGVPLLAQQVAFADRPGIDPHVRRRLGLDYRAASSADAWRAARAARLEREPPGR